MLSTEVLPSVEERINYFSKLFPIISLIKRILGSDPLPADAFNEYFDPNISDYSHPDLISYEKIKQDMIAMIDVLKPFRNEILKRA